MRDFINYIFDKTFIDYTRNRFISDEEVKEIKSIFLEKLKESTKRIDIETYDEYRDLIKVEFIDPLDK